MQMTQYQYWEIANRYLRSQPVKNAAYSVIFEGETASEAERDHSAPKGTVARAVKAVRREYKFYEQLLELSDK